MKAMMRVAMAALGLSSVAFGQELIANARVAVPVGVDLQVGTMVPVAAGPQVKDDLFAGTEKFAQGASGVTEINMDPKTMGMVPKGKNGEMAHKMKFMVIHSYQYDKPGMYKMEDVDVYRKKLEDGSWSCSVHVREKSSTTDICSRQGPDREGNEMVILTAEPKELTFIHMSGTMSLDEMGKMGGGDSGEDGKLKKR